MHGQDDLRTHARRYFAREVAAYDVQTRRCDLYGQDAGYGERVMLIYDGLHYDALAVAGARSCCRRARTHACRSRPPPCTAHVLNTGLTGPSACAAVIQVPDLFFSAC